VKPITARTLAVLRSRGAAGLTMLEALEAGCGARLAARVWELEAEGYEIGRTLETTPRGQRIARYRLHEAPTQLPLLDSPSGDTAIPSPQVVVSPLRSPRGALPVGSRAG